MLLANYCDSYSLALSPKLLNAAGHRENFPLCFQDVVCEGLGRRLPPPRRDVDPVLGRDPPARRAAVARQHTHPDGLAQQPHHFGLLNEQKGIIIS